MIFYVFQAVITSFSQLFAHELPALLLLSHSIESKGEEKRERKEGEKIGGEDKEKTENEKERNEREDMWHRK